jgi:hypothetical protein
MIKKIKGHFLTLLVGLFISNAVLLKAVEFVLVDACVDRGGVFLKEQFICNGENGAISLNLSNVFYILICSIFALLMAFIIKKLTVKSGS